jgi:hypothetical protein
MTIINAKDKPIGAGGNLPQMGEVIISWFQPLTFGLVVKAQADYDTVETVQDIETQGVRQPMGAQQLRIKPEGQRSWRWETLHCLPHVQLSNDDIVIFNGVKYRVMSRLDWAEYGYMEYHIAQTFTGAVNNG